MKLHPGIYLVAEQRMGQPAPGPLWLGTDEAATRFFAKLRDDGVVFSLTTGNRAMMTSPGQLPRMVWLETETGKTLAISRWLTH